MTLRRDGLANNASGLRPGITANMDLPSLVWLGLAYSADALKTPRTVTSIVSLRTLLRYVALCCCGLHR